MFAQPCFSSTQGPTENIVPIRLRVTERHRKILGQWLQAGQRMGLHDVDIVYQTPDETCPNGMVLVWVRESPDPAYRIAPDRMRWRVIDHKRDHTLGFFPAFEAALSFIRPVLGIA